MHEFQELLPAALRWLREITGLPSIRAAARRCREEGVAINTSLIAKWERGETAPYVRTLIAYLEVLGLDFDDFAAAIELLKAADEAALDLPAIRRRMTAKRYALTLARAAVGPADAARLLLAALR